MGRSTRSDGRTDHRPEVQSEDVHALIRALGGGPVDLFASSGGAVTALALVQRHPEDVATLVAHEPPLIGVLPDADGARRAWDVVCERYAERGFGEGMAAFIGFTSWSGEFDDAYLDEPAPDAAALGLPAADDGTRDDPLLSGATSPIIEFRPDTAVLRAVSTRVVVAVGEESGETLTGRTTRHVARLLGQDATVFPSHHDGFVGGGGRPGQPEAFAVRLREVLAGD
jgi:pimeloyl-ACP methyl ester carboxylesterase